MRRRTLLALPALGVLAACGPEDPDGEQPVSTPGTRRIAYGEDPAQYGELTHPAGTPKGVAVVVHGGFWKPQYGIEYARPLAPSLAAAGWTVWAIEYRRGTGAADTLADVLAAVAARPTHSGPVVGLGHSAGGHLVTWAGARPGQTPLGSHPGGGNQHGA